MELVTHIANWVAALANLYIALRLFTFRRSGRRYRRGVSMFAWLLFNATLFMAFWLITRGISIWWVAAPYSATCLWLVWLLHRHRGNLGEFF